MTQNGEDQRVLRLKKKLKDQLERRSVCERFNIYYKHRLDWHDKQIKETEEQLKLLGMGQQLFPNLIGKDNE